MSGQNPGSGQQPVDTAPWTPSLPPMPSGGDAERLIEGVKELWPAYGTRMSVAFAAVVLRRCPISVDALLGLLRRHKESRLDSRAPEWEAVMAHAPRTGPGDRYARGDAADSVRRKMVEAVDRTGHPLLVELLDADAARKITSTQLADWDEVLEAGRRGWQYSLAAWAIADDVPAWVIPGPPALVKTQTQGGSWYWPRTWCVRTRLLGYVPIEQVAEWQEHWQAVIERLVVTGPLSQRFIEQVRNALAVERSKLDRARSQLERTRQEKPKAVPAGVVAPDDEVPF